ncbi:hypothetical protein GCM10027053_48880 [Intrasporangium mesophilum]
MAAKRTEPTERPDEKPHRTAAGGMVWKLLSNGSTLLATAAATNVSRRGWKILTGRSVPARRDFDNERTRDVVLYTALSSMLVTTARVAVERSAAEYYRKSAGHLPKALESEKLTPKDAKAHNRLVRKGARQNYRLQKAINRASKDRQGSSKSPTRTTPDS